MKKALLLVCCALCVELFGTEEKGADAWLVERFGENLVNVKGEKIAVSELRGKIVGVYFSAHWCPPCRAFTPRLVAFRNAVAKEGFEIVFVSSDRNAEAMKGYMKDMDMKWLAVPFGSAKGKALKEKYHVTGIPTLVILDRNGNIITMEGRDEVASKSEKAFLEWRKK